MSIPQKVAWLNLIVSVLAILAYFALWPWIGPWRAMGAFGLLGLAGISSFLYVREKRSGRVVTDERDQMISLKAMTISIGVIWVGLILAFLVALRFLGENGAISVQGLSMVVWWTCCAFLVVQSS